MKNKKMIIKIFVIVLMTGCSFIAYAETYKKSRNTDEYKYREDCIDGIIKDIGLTSDQEDEIKSQSMEQNNLKKELYKTLINKRKELKSELVNIDTDKEGINKIAEEIKKLQSQIIDLKIEYVLKMKAVMTPEQYKLFNEKTESIFGRKRGKNKK